MSLATIKADMVTALATIPGLAVHDHVPDTWAEFPSAAVRLRTANYADGTYTFRILLAVVGWDEGEAELEVHPFLEPTGASSIKAALEAEPGCIVVSSGSIGRQQLNGLPYMGAELTVVARDV